MSRRVRWTGYLKGRDLLESLGGDWRVILKCFLNIKRGDVEGMHLAQNGVQWRVCENDIESSCFHTIWGISSLAKRPLAFQKGVHFWESVS